jgi:hypothetical protein
MKISDMLLARQRAQQIDRPRDRVFPGGHRGVAGTARRRRDADRHRKFLAPCAGQLMGLPPGLFRASAHRHGLDGQCRKTPSAGGSVLLTGRGRPSSRLTPRATSERGPARPTGRVPLPGFLRARRRPPSLTAPQTADLSLRSCRAPRGLFDAPSRDAALPADGGLRWQPGLP